MKVRFAVSLAVALLVCRAGFAQDTKLEITGDYSFVHVNPQNITLLGPST
jgi:hypothetical protein